MRRKDPKVTAKFQKNKDDEQFLRDLNTALTDLEESLQESTNDTFPIIFVLGVPRSGTTLLSQSLISKFDIGYVSNFVAAFWDAPLCGIRLAKKLDKGAFESSYESLFGQTSSVWEPHEFGYFWSSHLKYSEHKFGCGGNLTDDEWQFLANKLENMAAVSGKPFLHKNLLCNWHAARLASLVDNPYFIVVKRDPVDNALSLLELRKKMLGDTTDWASARPEAYDWLKRQTLWIQLAGQVNYLQAELDAQTASIPKDKILEIDLEDFCQNPDSQLIRVETMIKNTHPIQRRQTNFEKQFNYNSLSRKQPQDAEKIALAFEDLADHS